MSAQPQDFLNPIRRGGIDPERRHNVFKLARLYTEDAVNAVVSVLRDADASHRDKLTAAGMILDRAWGKPLQAVALDVTDNRDFKQLTRDELMQIAAGVVIEGETVEQTVSDK